MKGNSKIEKYFVENIFYSNFFFIKFKFKVKRRFAFLWPALGGWLDQNMTQLKVSSLS